MASDRPVLEAVEVSRSYGTDQARVQAIGSVSLRVMHGEFVVVVGPSGCGKTTLLRCLAGLQPPTSGEVRGIRGTPISGPPPEMAMVFQDYRSSLMPWLSVRQNVMLPLHHKKMAQAERDRLVDESVTAVGLAGFRDHQPWQLSGGMQQRVAIARALAYRPEILLMDEPFASVDAQTRADLEDLLLQLRREFDMTILLVTHDVDEAVYLGDRVVVLGPRPTFVKEDLAVVLNEPRDQIATKEEPEFVRLRAHVFGSVRNAAASAQK